MDLDASRATASATIKREHYDHPPRSLHDKLERVHHYRKTHRLVQAIVYHSGKNINKDLELKYGNDDYYPKEWFLTKII